MKFKEMRTKINEELEHIPRGDLNQNTVSALYNSCRARSLGKRSPIKYSKEEVVVQVLKVMIPYSQKFSLELDYGYFSKDKLIKAAKSNPDILRCIQ